MKTLLIALCSLALAGCVTVGRTCAEYTEEYYTPETITFRSVPGKAPGTYVQVQGGWERDCLAYSN